jgi:hypothetical protein
VVLVVVVIFTTQACVWCAVRGLLVLGSEHGGVEGEKKGRVGEAVAAQRARRTHQDAICI